MTHLEDPDGDEAEAPDVASYFRGRRLGRRVDGAWFVDAEDATRALDLSSCSKLLFLLLLLGLKDRASQIEFQATADDVGEPGCRLWYVVDGEPIPLVPPPRELVPHMVEELKRLAGLRSWYARLAGRLRAAADRLDGRPPSPDWGTFRIGTRDWSIEMVAAFHRTGAGDRCILTFKPADAAQAAEAQESLRRTGWSGLIDA